MKKLARFGLVALTSAGIALAGVESAAAAPQRGCPPPFELYTYSEQVSFYADVLGISRADARSLVDQILSRFKTDTDGALCFAFPNKNRLPFPNMIDNRARG